MPKPKLMTLRACKSNYIPQVVTVMLGFSGFIEFTVHIKFNIHFVSITTNVEGKLRTGSTMLLACTYTCETELPLGICNNADKSCPPHGILGKVKDEPCVCVH